jgi:hypothetical protein
VRPNLGASLTGVAVCLWLGVQPTVGGPPFVIDDPEPVEFRHWEVYLASQDAHVGGD